MGIAVGNKIKISVIDTSRGRENVHKVINENWSTC